MKRVATLVLMLSLMVALLAGVVFADAVYKPLLAGGGNLELAEWAGRAIASQDNDGNLVITYNTEGKDWCITETHLHVFQDNKFFTDVPHKNGNPIPGHFDYKGEHDCVQEVVYTIPKGDWEVGDELYIAAHAVVRETGECECDCTCQEETAWAGCPSDGDSLFPGRNWAVYFTYVVQDTE
jgi:hypothetical protein